ncbi:ribokinase [Propionibacterium sp.]|uniref:ribokinase n=1 Tax=Propionibacterium sp. TaxID=1977903 RepID=UPI0039E9CDFB
MDVLDRLQKTTPQGSPSAASRSRVVVVGSLNADLTVTTARLPGPGETVPGGPLRTLPGGKSANQAVMSGLLGVPTAMIGAVGADEHGTMLMNSLNRAGVDTRHVQRCGAATGTAVITVDAQGENTIVVSPSANGNLGAAEVQAGEALFRDAGSLGLCLEVGDEALLAAASIAHEEGVITVLNPSPLRDLPDDLVDLTDVLVVNEHELAVFTRVESGTSVQGGVNPEQATRWARALADRGIDRAVLTLGSQGSVVMDHGEVRVLPAFTVHTVDTTGCGDACTGSVLAALAARIPLAEGAVLAGAVSALAATREGAQLSYPGAAEVRDFLVGR